MHVALTESAGNAFSRGLAQSPRRFSPIKSDPPRIRAGVYEVAARPFDVAMLALAERWQPTNVARDGIIHRNRGRTQCSHEKGRLCLNLWEKEESSSSKTSKSSPTRWGKFCPPADTTLASSIRQRPQCSLFPSGRRTSPFWT